MKDKHRNIKKILLMLIPLANLTWGLLLLRLVATSEIDGLFRISLIVGSLAYALSGFVPILLYGK